MPHASDLLSCDHSRCKNGTRSSTPSGATLPRGVNDMADTVDEYTRFGQAEMNPYSEIQCAWTLARANQMADFQVQYNPDQALLETLESVYFTFKDPEFRGHGQTRSVLLPGWRTKTWPDSMPRLPQNN